MKRADDPRHLEVGRGEDRSPDAGWDGWLPEGVAPPSPRWQPEGGVAGAEDAPWEAMRYVVVDDLFDDGALLVSYMWPSVTGAGTLYFGDDPRLVRLPDDDGAWGDSAPGMPLIFREISLPGDSADDYVVSFEVDAGSPGSWMKRQHVQGAIDAARGGVQSSGAVAFAGDEDQAPELSRALRIGDTFAVVIASQDDVEVIAYNDEPPTESVALEATQLTDITRQARTVAKAAQISALTKPRPVQQRDDDGDGSVAKAMAWELEGDIEVFRQDIDTADLGSDPRDAQPTV